MAAVVSAAVGSGSTSNVTTFPSGSFTPVAGDLIVIAAHASGTIDANSSATASANGITFTRVIQALANAGGNRMAVYVANQLVPASPVAMTVSVVFSSSATGCAIEVLRVSGMTKTGATAVLQSVAVDNNLTASVTPTATFAAAPQAGNPVIGSVGNNTTPATLTPPTGFTERADLGYSTPTTGLEVVSIDSGSPQTVTWGNTSTRGGVQLVELDASSSSASAFTGSLALSGSGTLARTATPAITASQGLSGAGTLALSGTATVPPLDFTGTLALTGSGSLAATGTPQQTGTLGLTGAGALTETGTPTPSGTLGLTGSGTLTQAGTPKPAASLGLTGSGTLQATGTSSQSASFTGTLALSGAGVFAASGTPATTGVVGLNGTGTQGDTATPKVTSQQSLTGSGTVALTGTPRLTKAIALSGGSLLALSGKAAVTGSLDRAGTGTQTTSGTPAPSDTLALSGEGVLLAASDRSSRDITIFLTPPAFDWDAVLKPQDWDAEARSFEWEATLLGQVWDASIGDFRWATDAPSFVWAATISDFTWAAGPPNFD